MRKLTVSFLVALTSLGLTAPANASPLGINYLATADCGTLNVALTNLGLITPSTTKSELAAKVKTSSLDIFKGMGISGPEADMLASKTGIDVSNRALECQIVKEDPKIMGSIELPTQLADLKVLLSN